MIAFLFAPRRVLVLAAAVLGGMIPVSAGLKAQESQPTFRSSVAVVPITAVVRDGKNRLVRELRKDDFQVFEDGQPRRVIDFNTTDRSAVSLGVLFDTSGSMRGTNLLNGKTIVNGLVDQLDHPSDELALFTFDKAIRQDTPFTNNPYDVREAVEHVEGWGLTSLYDAIADTASRVAERRGQRRAVIVVTDGEDTSSTLSSGEVSGLASAIDVPVYILMVDPPRRERGEAMAPRERALFNLAQWTGGELRHVPVNGMGPALASLMAELRQQYFLAIESATRDGWYRIDVRTRRKGLSVRARTGYFANAAPRSGVE